MEIRLPYFTESAKILKPLIKLNMQLPYYPRAFIPKKCMFTQKSVHESSQ